MPAIVAGARSFLDAKGRRRYQQVRADQVFNRVEKPRIPNQPVDTLEQQVGLEIERPSVVRMFPLEGLDPVTQIACLGRPERRERSDRPLAPEFLDLFRRKSRHQCSLVIWQAG